MLANRNRLVCHDLIDFLNRGEPRTYDAFSLSNILDGCDAAYGSALVAAVRRAAAPGAMVVLRTFAETPSPGRDWRALDRSHLWGSVAVERVDGHAVATGGRFGCPVDWGLGHANAA